MGLLLESAERFLRQYGYLAADQAVESFEDDAFTQAVALFQQRDANVHLAAEHLGLDMVADGEVGPATLYAMNLPRCGHADNEVTDAALGTGGWQGCHGADGMHHATVLVDPKNKPAFLQPVFNDILRRVQNSYAELGLLFRFCEARSGQVYDVLTGKPLNDLQGINIDFTFTRGSGWIGLAIVGMGSNQRCSSRIWAKFEYKYRPADVVTQWVTLIKHELGHNCGLRHTSGGVMNPGLINGLPNAWVDSDPSTRTLRRWFGGQPVDVPEIEPPEPPTPEPPGTTPAPGQPLGEAFTLHDGTRAQLFRAMGGKR